MRHHGHILPTATTAWDTSLAKLHTWAGRFGGGVHYQEEQRRFRNVCLRAAEQDLTLAEGLVAGFDCSP